MSNVRDFQGPLEERSRRVRGPVDSSGGPPHDGGMEARVAKLEADLPAIKIDVAVIKANGATKSDIAELRSAVQTSIAGLERDMAKGHTRIIMWVVGAIIFAQLLPVLKELFR